MQTCKTTIPSWAPDVARIFTSDSWPFPYLHYFAFAYAAFHTWRLHVALVRRVSVFEGCHYTNTQKFKLTASDANSNGADILLRGLGVLWILSCLCRVQWWHSVFWNSSFRLGFFLMAMFDTMSGPLSTYKSFTLANEDSGEIGQKLISFDAIASPLRLVSFCLESLLPTNRPELHKLAPKHRRKKCWLQYIYIHKKYIYI